MSPNVTVEVGIAGLFVPAQSFFMLFLKELWKMSSIYGWHGTPITLEGLRRVDLKETFLFLF